MLPGVSYALAAPEARIVRVDGPLTVEGLGRIRQAIADRTATWDLDEHAGYTLQVICSELTSNIIKHAGGDGRLVLTYRTGSLYCQAIDRGPGMARPFLAGWSPPDWGDPAAARGLWMVRMLSVRMQIDSSVLGTTVTALVAGKV